MPIAWHSPTWWNWCVPDNEKKETKKLRKDEQKDSGFNCLICPLKNII